MGRPEDAEHGDGLPESSSEPDPLLDTTDLAGSGLRRRAVRGTAASVSGQFLNTALQIGSLAILARLVPPDDHGVVAMVLSVTAIVMVLQDFGLSAATIQRTTLNRQQISNLFWINAATGVCIGLALIVSAPWLAKFFNDPRVQEVAYWLALHPIFASLTPQHRAVLARQMRFGAIARNTVIGLLVGILCGVLVAAITRDYRGIVMVTLATSITTSGLMWLSTSWIPHLPRRTSGMRDLLGFGANLGLAQTLDRVSRNADNLLIGRYSTAADVGLYQRAYQLLMLPLTRLSTPLTTVTVPTLSRLKDDPARYRRFFMRAVSALSIVGKPVVVFSAVCAVPIIDVLLGADWSASATLFQYLAIAGFVQVTGSSMGWVYISLNRTGRQLKWMMVNAVVNVTAFAIGVSVAGAAGVAIAYSISVVLRRPFAMWYCFSGTPIRMRDFFSCVWRPTIASIASGLVVLGFIAADVSLPSIAVIAAAGAMYSVAYAAFMLLCPGGLQEVRNLVALTRDLRSTRSSKDGTS